MAYWLDEYVKLQTQHQHQIGEHQVGAFELPNGNAKMLQINFGVPSSTGAPVSMVWIKRGSMVAYRGNVSFRREGMLEHGVGNMLKKAMTSEGTTLTRASAKGRAQLYVADSGKVVTIFRLRGDTITVNGDDLLAFEPTVSHKIRMLKSMSAIASGGLFNIKLSGHGFVAILTRGKPITFTVGRGLPSVYTDPDATVAWTGDLLPDFNTDIQFKSFFGRGSGESFQMKFDGNQAPGVVLVQPHEEKFSHK